MVGAPSSARVGGRVVSDCRRDDVIDSVRDRRTFRSFGRPDRRVTSGVVRVRFLDDASDPPRVAYAIGRHVGGAVVRNRVRRRLREAVRSSSRVAPGSYLVSVDERAADCSYRRLADDLAGALDRLDEQAVGPSRS